MSKQTSVVSDNTRHAQILADIARQVVESHRRGDATESDVLVALGEYDEHLAEQGGEDVLGPIDPSWNYQLPERYRG